jgi:hypothetical protein
MTKYPGQNHDIKIHNKAFERVEQLIYLGTILTIQNSIHGDIKSRKKTHIACYHSVQNLMSSSLLSKNIKIKIQRAVIFPVLVYGCVAWFLALRVFKNTVLRKTTK